MWKSDEIYGLLINELKIGSYPLKNISLKCLSNYIRTCEEVSFDYLGIFNYIKTIPCILNKIFEISMESSFSSEINRSLNAYEYSIDTFIDSWGQLYLDVLHIIRKIHQISSFHTEIIAQLFHRLRKITNSQTDYYVNYAISAINVIEKSSLEFTNSSSWYEWTQQFISKHALDSYQLKNLTSIQCRQFESNFNEDKLCTLMTIMSDAYNSTPFSFHTWYNWTFMVLCCVNTVKNIESKPDWMNKYHLCHFIKPQLMLLFRDNSNETDVPIKERKQRILKLLGLFIIELQIFPENSCCYTPEEIDLINASGTWFISKTKDENQMIVDNTASTSDTDVLLDDNESICNSIPFITLDLYGFSSRRCLRKTRHALFNFVMKLDRPKTPIEVSIILNYLRNCLVHGLDFNVVVSQMEDILSTYASILFTANQENNQENNNSLLLHQYCTVLQHAFCPTVLPSNGIATKISINVSTTHTYMPLSHVLQCDICGNTELNESDAKIPELLTRSREEVVIGSGGMVGMQVVVLKLVYSLVQKFRAVKLMSTDLPIMRKLITTVSWHTDHFWTEETVNGNIMIFRVIMEACKENFCCNVSIAIDNFLHSVSLNPSSKHLSMVVETFTNKIDDLIRYKSDNCVHYALIVLEILMKYVSLKTMFRPLKSALCVLFIDDDDWVKYVKLMMNRVIEFRNDSSYQILKSSSSIIAMELLKKEELNILHIDGIADCFNMAYQETFDIFLVPIFVHLATKTSPTSLKYLKTFFDSYTIRYGSPNNEYRKMEVYNRVISESMVYFFMNYDKSSFPSIIDFVEKAMNQPLKHVLTPHVEKIVHLLMLHLSERYELVMRALRWLAQDLSDLPNTESSSSTDSSHLGSIMQSQTSTSSTETSTFSRDDVILFLRPYFEGILDHFKIQFVKDDGLCLSFEKERAVNSLEMFVNLIGPDNMKHLRAMYFNILKICLKIKGDAIRKKVLNLWLGFLKMLDIEELKSLVVESVAVLISDELSDGVAVILSYIFTKRTELGHLIGNIHFILRKPSLSRFVSDIKMTLADTEPECGEPEFHQLLEYGCHNLRHNSASVRYLAGSHIEYTLSRPTPIYMTKKLHLQLDNTSGHSTAATAYCPHISSVRLMHQLTHNLLYSVAKATDIESGLVYGRCLGLLGAVDPDRYRDTEFEDLSSMDPDGEFVNSINFSFTLLNEIAREYLTVTNPLQIDNCALALQELLKAFYINLNETEFYRYATETCELRHFAFHQHMLMGDKLWKLFPRHISDVFRPFLNSRFFATIDIDFSKISQPIFGVLDNNRFESWICKWVSYMISLISNLEHIRIFRCVRYLATCDVQFSKFLLPHIVLVMLIENKYELAVRAEFDAVLAEFDSEEKYLLNTSNFMNTTQSFTVTGSFENNDDLSSQRLYSASQIIFTVLDYLRKWLDREASIIADLEAADNCDSDLINIKFLHYENVKRFVHTISYRQLACVSYQCGSLARSVMYGQLAFIYQTNLDAEDYEVGVAKEILLGLLQTLSALSDTEEISGYLTKFKSELGGLSNEPIKLEYEGKMAEASLMYEKELLEKQNDQYDDIPIDTSDLGYSEGVVSLYESIFRTSLQDIHNLPSLISRIESALGNDPEMAINMDYFHSFNSTRVDALARLGNWKRLESAISLEHPETENWTVSILKPITEFKDYRESSKKMLESLWSKQITHLKMAAIEGCNYQRLYDDICKLSALTDIEMSFSVVYSLDKDTMATEDNEVENLYSAAKLRRRIDRFPTTDEPTQLSIIDLIDFFKRRYKVTETDPTTRDKILVLHQLLLLKHINCLNTNYQMDISLRHELTKIIQDNIGKLWLQRAKVARYQKQFLSALYCLNRIRNSSPELDIIIEKGKIIWKEGRTEEALNYLNDSLEDINTRIQQKTNTYKKHRLGKAYLLRAHLSDITYRYDFETTRKLYHTAIQSNRRTESAHFRLADFLDRTIKQTSTNHDVLIKEAISSYGQSLMYGSKFVYQSMSRFLSLWLYQTTESKLTKSVLEAITETIRQLMNNIPKFQFYIGINQLVSQLCHENLKQRSDLLIELIAEIFIEYPQQTSWVLMLLENSRFSKRQEQFRNVIQAVKNRKSDLGPYIQKMVQLCKALRELSETSVDKGALGSKLLNWRRDRRCRLARLMENKEQYQDIMLPLYNQLFANLPLKTSHSTIDKFSQFRPFLAKPVCLYDIDENVSILASVTRPKKMTWVGNDGTRYIFVAKPKDDMRRDCRIQELNGIFNRLMRNNGETRHKALYIRTYAVMPLGEQSGLIEWVNNTSQYRTIIKRLCTLNREIINEVEIRKKYPLLEDSKEVKYEKFTRDVLPLFPVLLHQWLYRQFPVPSTWLHASRRFSRSTAVMSMVGYVLGLGDRHVENLLLDQTTGDVVHIDFSCLFEHGRSLQWPELVPFRLTRNMTDALGPCGSDSGDFRASCTATMRLLRQQFETIMAVFKPMYYETLLESKTSRPPAAANAPSAETNSSINAMMEKLSSMENRLSGIVNQLPMSVEGQVASLIADAIDNRLLSHMYVGWASYI